MTTIPALPFSGQQLRDTLSALDGAIDTKEASGAAAAAVAAHVAGADPHSQYTTTVEAAAAAPVQSVALSVPGGWSGSSASTSGNVTLTLGLPAGSSLVGSSDRTSWDTAFTERNRWDGGATGLNASTGRTSLGLENVDNTSDAAKPVSSATATALAGKANTGAIGSSGLTMNTARLLGRSTAGSGAPEEISVTGATLSGGILTISGGAANLSYTPSTRLLSSSTGTGATLPLFSSTDAGLAPSSGGGTSNFLRADGTWATPAGTGGGTVNSVGLSLPSIFSVSGSPVTNTGTLTGTLANQNVNVVLAGPTSGGAAAPTFRALVAADLPATAVVTGSYGAAGSVATFTVDAQGRLTAAGSTSISISTGQVSGFAAAAAAAAPVQSVTATAPITSSGGSAPAIGISAATTGAPGSMSAADKTKLEGIAAGAEVNVNADWNAGSGDAQILNKPTLGTAAALNVGTSAGTVAAGDDARLTYDSPWLALGDETTAATAGTKVTVHHWPLGHRLTAIPLWSASAPVTSALQFDIRVGGTSIFSTLPTIAVGGVSSTTTTPAVFSAAFVSANQTIAAGSLVTFHVTQAPSGGGGAGAKVLMPAVRV